MIYHDMRNVTSIAIIYHDYRGVTTVHITAAQAKAAMAHIKYSSSFLSNLTQQHGSPVSRNCLSSLRCITYSFTY